MYHRFNAIAISLATTISVVALELLLPKGWFGEITALRYIAIFVGAALLYIPLIGPLSRLTAPLYQKLRTAIGGKRDGFDYDWLDTEMSESSEKEIEILQNAMDFSDLRVRDCMVQRVDIEAVDIVENSIEELRRLFFESQYSRIMVYRDTIDNIVGYVNVKALFLLPKRIEDILREVLVVTESMSAERLLESLIREKRSIAVVVDEFGGTAGMVTLEDILEEIFGEIEDEYDTIDTIERQLPSGDYLFSGRLEVEYLNERYGLAIQESEEYETLAGYIIYHNEDIPKQGEVIELSGREFRIVKLSGSKIDLIKVTAIDPLKNSLQSQTN